MIKSTNLTFSLWHFASALQRLGSGQRSSGDCPFLFRMLRSAPLAARKQAIDAALFFSAPWVPSPIISCNQRKESWFSLKEICHQLLLPICVCAEHLYGFIQNPHFPWFSYIWELTLQCISGSKVVKPSWRPASYVTDSETHIESKSKAKKLKCSFWLRRNHFCFYSMSPWRCYELHSVSESRQNLMRQISIWLCHLSYGSKYIWNC